MQATTPRLTAESRDLKTNPTTCATISSLYKNEMVMRVMKSNVVILNGVGSSAPRSHPC